VVNVYNKWRTWAQSTELSDTDRTLTFQSSRFPSSIRPSSCVRNSPIVDAASVRTGLDSCPCYIERVLAQRHVLPDRIRPLRRIEYESLVTQGLLDDARIELLCGALVEMTPQGPLHANVIRRLAEKLVRATSERVHVRVQMPLALSDDSEPEPDIAVVPAGDYDRAHPAHALLVIEVAETSLQKDRGIKTALYATAGIPEFWLVDLTQRVIEVHRQPTLGRYTDIQRVDRSGQLTPGELPQLSIAVDEIFGP
jgi:Uma2 family endonuclease